MEASIHLEFQAALRLHFPLFISSKLLAFKTFREQGLHMHGNGIFSNKRPNVQTSLKTFVLLVKKKKKKKSLIPVRNLFIN